MFHTLVTIPAVIFSNTVSKCKLYLYHGIKITYRGMKVLVITLVRLRVQDRNMTNVNGSVFL